MGRYRLEEKEDVGGVVRCWRIVATVHRALPHSFDCMLKGKIPAGCGWGGLGLGALRGLRECRECVGRLFKDLGRKAQGK